MCVGASTSHVLMLSVRHLRCVARRLMTQQRSFTSRWHVAASSAADRRHYATTKHTKAVIFDMGGVLIPSPLPFLASMYMFKITHTHAFF